MIFDSADQDALSLHIYIDGVLAKTGTSRASGSNIGGLSVQGKFKLAVGQKVTIFAANGTTPDTVSGGANETYFDGCRIA